MIISGKLELDYYLYARAGCPVAPVFSKLLNDLIEKYPQYMVMPGPTSQVIINVQESHVSTLDNLGIIVNEVGQALIKKQTIEVALPDSDLTTDEYVKILTVISKEVEILHSQLVTSRIVLTTFVSNEIAF